MLNDLTVGFDHARAVIERGPSSLDTQLSEQEYKVMHGLARGDAIQDIAVVMNLSPSTVSTYRKRVLTKLNFTRDAQITLFVAMNEGLLKR